MMITSYSFITAVLWFSLLLVVADLLRRKLVVFVHYNIRILLLILGLSAVRLLVPIELPFTVGIDSYAIFPTIKSALTAPISALGTETTLIAIALSLWAVGSVFCLVGFLCRMCHDNRIIQTIALSSLHDDRIVACFDEVISQPKKPRACGFLLSHNITTPMVVGLFRPTILLPHMVTELSDDSLRYILIHEWYHISHRDLWFKCFVELLCCAMWWNPAVYLLKHDLDQALELNCDLHVTQTMSQQEKMTYMRTILHVVAYFTEHKPSHSDELPLKGVAYVGRSDDTSTKQRFQTISQYRTPKRRHTLTFSAIILVLFFGSYSMVLQPAGHPPIEDISNAFTMSPETTYILATEDGKYTVIHEGTPLQVITKEALSDAPYDLLSITYD